MAMTMKEILLIVWILALVALAFFFRHFWSCAVYLMQKAVALSFIPLPSLVKLAAVICGVQFVL